MLELLISLILFLAPYLGLDLESSLSGFLQSQELPEQAQNVLSESPEIFNQGKDLLRDFDPQSIQLPDGDRAAELIDGVLNQ